MAGEFFKTIVYMFGCVALCLGLTCHNGYVKYKHGEDEACFRGYSRTRTQSSARSYCQNLGSDYKLATIRTAGELEFIKNNILNELYVSAAWISATDADNEGMFTWPDEDPLGSFLAWGTNEPNGGTAENCVAIKKSDGNIYDVKCNLQRGTICEKRTRPPALQCGYMNRGWDQMDLGNGGGAVCFGVELQHTTFWRDARFSCESRGAHLAILRNDDEKRHLWYSIKDYKGGLWIGATDCGDEGNFQNLDGTAVLSYDVKGMRWNRRQPNGKYLENCVAMDRKFKISDEKCSSRKAFVCMKRSSGCACDNTLKQCMVSREYKKEKQSTYCLPKSESTCKT